MDQPKGEVPAEGKQSEDIVPDEDQTIKHEDTTPNQDISEHKESQAVTEDSQKDPAKEEPDINSAVAEQSGPGSDQGSGNSVTDENTAVAAKGSGEDVVTAPKDCEDQAPEEGIKKLDKMDESQSDKTPKEAVAPIPIPVPRDSKEISVEKDKDIKPADESEKVENTAVENKPCKSEGGLEIKVSTKQDAGTKANGDEKKSSTSDTHSAKENKQSTDKPKKPEKMPSGQDHLESDLPNKERGGKSYSAQRSGSRVVGKKVEEEPKKFGKGSVEVRASDGKGGYDERKGGQTGQRRGKEIDVRNEKGTQRTRDRDRERDRERDKPRGDLYKDKTSERR